MSCHPSPDRTGRQPHRHTDTGAQPRPVPHRTHRTHRTALNRPALHRGTSHTRHRKEHHPMTTIGILGAGRVGGNLARKLAASGHHVVLGRRRPQEETAAPAGDLDPRISFADQRTTARDADVVINATPGDTALERLVGLRAELAGKILVDVSNATRDADDGLPGDLCYPGSSLAEQLQAALPDTRVVKTLNTMLFTVMTAPESLGTPPTVYVSGNDKEAKETVTGLLGDLGWQTAWTEDLGDITTARATEAMILVVPHVLRRHGFKPFAVSLAR
ncbi:NADP oxidoreductase [Streptomyces maremycinicus]|nr:NADP oxidoreductase [Streptomyces sp. B9173]